MKRFLETIGVTFFGLSTSILTAILVVVIARLTSFNLFTFSVLFIVPAGAIAVGFAAASGYYYGCLYFHRKPTIFLLLQMVAIAGATQMLIYYMGYRTLVLDDGSRAADYIPFFDYMEIYLTKTHYRVGRVGVDTGEVGSLGYWIAVIQFVGFLVGGGVLYAILMSRPVCTICNLYLRELISKEKIFIDSDDASRYYETIFTHPVDGPEFAEMVRTPRIGIVRQGAVSIKTTLLGCPQCKKQLIEDGVKLHNGKEWNDVKGLSRRVGIPSGIDLVQVFRA